MHLFWRVALALTAKRVVMATVTMVTWQLLALKWGKNPVLKLF